MSPKIYWVLGASLLILVGVQGLSPASTDGSVGQTGLPQHVAIMMDGNGRWAKAQGKPRVFGHQNSMRSLNEAIEGCIELGIPYLTLYAFSTENWTRPTEEISTLMQLFTTTLREKLGELMQHNIKLTAIGNLTDLPTPCQEALHQAIQTTQHNQGLHLIVALSYSGRWDITQASEALARDIVAGDKQLSDISPDVLATYLSTTGIPDPDLLIRTGGDMRISNFLLWQLAYTELYIEPVYWPNFRKEHLYQAVQAYQARERRFGNVTS
ncbi:MAG: isoprenyl transferase [Bacteroidota bacterium]